MINKIIKKIKYELKFNNTNYSTRISDKVLKTYYQLALRSKIAKLKPVQIDSENALFTVSMLASHRNFIESIAALYSLYFWEKRFHLHYHEDGSLSEKEITLLKVKFPGITLFRRKEQNQKVTSYLKAKGLEISAKLREEFVFSLRLFDMILAKKTTYILQYDSDVLFFAKPQEIIDIVEKKNFNGCYNLDVVDAYTFSKEICDKYVKVPMVKKFNAGLFLHNFEESFFDFIESVIKNQPEAFTSWHLEQTLFAMKVSIDGNFLPLPEKYDLGRIRRNEGKELTSEHYVHSTGYDLHKDFINKVYPLYAKR